MIHHRDASNKLSAFPQVYVLKRPYVDEFLRRMGELFECVLFTASLAKVPGGRRGVKNWEQAWQLQEWSSSSCWSTGCQRETRTASKQKASSLLAVCRPCDRSAGQVWGIPGPPVP